MKRKNLLSNCMSKGMVLMNGIAMLLVVNSVNIACSWIFHQPEVPDEVKKYRKF